MNPWHLLMYGNTSGGALADADLVAPVDGIFQRRNSHIIISEPYNLIGVLPIGATLSRLRFANPSMITHGQPHLWPLAVSATMPTLPPFNDYRDYPILLPMNEEITLSATTGAADQASAALFVAGPGWNQNIPQGFPRFMARATVVIAAGAEDTWGLPVAIVMERDLLNGVYAVTGAWVVAANALAFRIQFPSMPTFNGRQLRPGGLTQNTAALNPMGIQRFGFGEWGRFHTFELPSIQIYSDAAGGTYEVRLELVYLGNSTALLQQ